MNNNLEKNSNMLQTSTCHEVGEFQNALEQLLGTFHRSEG